MELTAAEGRLCDVARERVREHARSRRDAGLTDVLYAFALSSDGSVYTGIPLETGRPHGDHCAERHALNELRIAEPEGSVEAVLVAGPVPDEDRGPTMPCGTCRDVIHELGGPDTMVLASCFVRQEDGWDLFPVMERYAVSELYPEPYERVSWD